MENIFDFMNRSMQKYYPNQSSVIKLTSDQQQQRRISTTVKIKNKLAQAKEHSCPCT